MDRFQGLPDDRLGRIARALSNAGTAYIEEAAPSDQGSAHFFENTIDRALLPLIDPNTASRSIGRSFSLVDLEEADLVHLIGNMKLVISSQREEIHCLRMTVQELVMEIADGQDLGSAPNVPAVIQVEDSSSENSIDKGIFRSRSCIPERASRSGRKDTTDDYSYLLSSIARSKSSFDSTSHIEPEGRYAPKDMKSEFLPMRSKKDPPSGDDGDDMPNIQRSVSWNDAEAGSDHGEQPHPPKRSNGNKQPSEGEEVSRDLSFEAEEKKAVSQVSSPSRDHAKRIVQERRRRYQNFRRSREVEESRRKQKATLREHQQERAQSQHDNSTDEKAAVAAVASELPKNSGYQPVSPMVRFREDELTLMETKATTIEKQVDQ